MFYAERYPYGKGMVGTNGEPIKGFYRFETKAERDQWVSEGPDYLNESGYRAVASSSDFWLRRWQAQEHAMWVKAPPHMGENVEVLAD